eukprot:COSAG01_NODE_234_length_20921_cov_5.890403_13_plen_115_part_00
MQKLVRVMCECRAPPVPEYPQERQRAELFLELPCKRTCDPSSGVSHKILAGHLKLTRFLFCVMCRYPDYYQDIENPISIACIKKRISTTYDSLEAFQVQHRFLTHSLLTGGGGS